MPTLPTNVQQERHVCESTTFLATQLHLGLVRVCVLHLNQNDSFIYFMVTQSSEERMVNNRNNCRMVLLF